MRLVIFNLFKFDMVLLIPVVSIKGFSGGPIYLKDDDDFIKRQELSPLSLEKVL